MPYFYLEMKKYNNGGIVSSRNKKILLSTVAYGLLNEVHGIQAKDADDGIGQASTDDMFAFSQII